MTTNQFTQHASTYYSMVNRLLKQDPMEGSATRTSLGSVINMPTPGYGYIDDLFKRISTPEFALVRGEFKKVAGRYARGEAEWYMTRDHSYTWLNERGMDKNGIWKSMQDKDGNLNSNYGYRLETQNNIEEEFVKAAQFLSNPENKGLPYVVHLDIADQDNIGDAKVKDMVCNNRLSIALKIMKSTLEIASYTTCRSLDISMGLPYDTVAMQGFTLNFVWNVLNVMKSPFKGKINYGCNAFIVSNLHLYNSNVLEETEPIIGEKRQLVPWINVERVEEIPYHPNWDGTSHIDNPKVSGYDDNSTGKSNYVYRALLDLVKMKRLQNGHARRGELKKFGNGNIRRTNSILKKDPFTRRLAKFGETLSYFAKDGQTGEEYTIEIAKIDESRAFLMHTFVIYDDSETDPDFEEYLKNSRMPSHFHLKSYSAQHAKPLPRHAERMIYITKNRPASSATSLVENLIVKSPRVKYVVVAIDSPDSSSERKYTNKNYNVIYIDNVIFKDGGRNVMSSLCEALYDTMNTKEKIWQIQANSFKYLINSFNTASPYPFAVIPSMYEFLERLGGYMMDIESAPRVNLQYSTQAARNISLTSIEQLYGIITGESFNAYAGNFKHMHSTASMINLPLVGFDFEETVVDAFKELLNGE